MAKLVPLTLVAVCAFASPALAQDPDVPGLDRWAEKAQKFMQRVEELVEPLMRKLEETLQALTQELETWMQDIDPNEMFGEFNLEQWADELRRMFEQMQPPQGDEDDEDMRLPDSDARLALSC